MSGIDAIAGTAFGAGDAAAIMRLGLSGPPAEIAAASGPGSFSSLLAEGLREVDGKVATANGLVRQFALDDSVPLHQVTYALEEARLAVELAMQVRARLVESYRELMNMQL